MTVLEYSAGSTATHVSEQMSRWIERVLGPDFRGYSPRQHWGPPINLYEDDVCFFLIADLAGLDVAKIDLQVEGRRVLIRGQRPSPRPGPGNTMAECAAGTLRLHMMEIDDGAFLRALELPATVDNAKVEACYQTGLLWIRLPKTS